MMAIVMLLAAVVVTITLNRQESRHARELAAEYLRLKRSIPPRERKVPVIQSWFELVLGLCLLAAGVFGLVASSAADAAGVETGTSYLMGIILAVGVVLVASGGRGILRRDF
jgi:hypothetical protein